VGEVRDLSSARSARARGAEHELSLHAEPGAARIVRHWVMRVVAAAGIGGALNQLVEVLTAELVSEAVRTGTPDDEVGVRLHIDEDGVRVTITGPGGASLTPSSATSLALVEVLSNAWGSTRDRDGQRTVWFDIATAG
jgi:hypothetical protein